MKFGKRKYNRGRIKEVGFWEELTMEPTDVFLRYALTTSVIRGGNHGYVHEDVNHSINFVDPTTGAHVHCTNSIEGTWTHVKKHSTEKRWDWEKNDRKFDC